MKKIMVVVGARPNFMKVSRLKRVAEDAGLQVELVHTGQHVAERMTTVFFEQFGITPDHVLEIADGTATARIAHMMLGLGPLFERTAPDLVMVVGDVDSSLAGALTANRMRIPLVHLESGLRSGDLSMPEEVNRILVDRIADHLLVTEPSGRENLLREGRQPEVIHTVGNTMIDTLVAFDRQIQASRVLEELQLEGRPHVLVTMHRPATVDDPVQLKRLVEMLEWLANDLQVVWPVHPRTQNNLQKSGLFDRLKKQPALRILPPLDYFSFQKLLATSIVVLTDSGGIQEETTFRRVPCLTLRNNTERPITITEGSNRLVPFDQAELQKAVEEIRTGDQRKGRIPELWDGQATERVIEVLRALV